MATLAPRTPASPPSSPNTSRVAPTPKKPTKQVKPPASPPSSDPADPLALGLTSFAQRLRKEESELDEHTAIKLPDYSNDSDSDDENANSLSSNLLNAKGTVLHARGTKQPRKQPLPRPLPLLNRKPPLQPSTVHNKSPPSPAAKAWANSNKSSSSSNAATGTSGSPKKKSFEFDPYYKEPESIVVTIPVAPPSASPRKRKHADLHPPRPESLQNGLGASRPSVNSLRGQSEPRNLPSRTAPGGHVGKAPFRAPVKKPPSSSSSASLGKTFLRKVYLKNRIEAREAELGRKKPRLEIGGGGGTGKGGTPSSPIASTASENGKEKEKTGACGREKVWLPLPERTIKIHGSQAPALLRRARELLKNTLNSQISSTSNKLRKKRLENQRDELEKTAVLKTPGLAGSVGKKGSPDKTSTPARMGLADRGKENREPNTPPSPHAHATATIEEREELEEQILVSPAPIPATPRVRRRSMRFSPTPTVSTVSVSTASVSTETEKQGDGKEPETSPPGSPEGVFVMEL